MRIAVAGKGGSGKSVIAGTMARVMARRGHRVLALDSDLMPGLSLSLGAPAPDAPPLLEAVERDENGRWRFRKGIGPVRAVQRYSTPAPDGVWLLQAGKVTAEGLPPIIGSIQAFYAVIHGLAEARALSGWTFLGDLPAGPRQAAFDWAPYAELFLVVVEPTWKSALTARRVLRIARARGRARALAVANKVAGDRDRVWIERAIREPVLATIPADPAVGLADRRGTALIDDAPGAPAVSAIESLVDALDGEYAKREVLAG